MPLTESVRRGLSESDMIMAVLDGKLTTSEKNNAMWILRAFNWTFPPGTSTELVRRVTAVCPLLNQTTAEAAAEPAPAAPQVQPTLRKPKPTEPEPMDGIRGRTYGLQPQE